MIFFPHILLLPGTGLTGHVWCTPCNTVREKKSEDILKSFGWKERSCFCHTLLSSDRIRGREKVPEFPSDCNFFPSSKVCAPWFERQNISIRINPIDCKKWRVKVCTQGTGRRGRSQVSRKRSEWENLIKTRFFYWFLNRVEKRSKFSQSIDFFLLPTRNVWTRKRKRGDRMWVRSPILYYVLFCPRLTRDNIFAPRMQSLELLLLIFSSLFSLDSKIRGVREKMLIKLPLIQRHNNVIGR